MLAFVKKLVQVLVAIALGGVAVSSIALAYHYNKVQGNLESLINIDLPQGLQSTKIFARDYDPKTGRGTLLATLYLENREYVSLKDIPKPLIDCTLAIEDKRFYVHGGVDFSANVRAIFAIVKSGGELVQGGSTITQQLARNVFLPYIKSQKTLNRKVQEIVLARSLESKFTKEEILENYLNNIFYGAGAYGVKAAASTYFRKDISELTLAESALIAGLPQKPSALNPFVNLKGALERRNVVLSRLLAVKRSGKFLDLDYLSEEEIKSAMEEEIQLAERTEPGTMRAPHFSSWVREQLYEKYGEDQVLRQGLVVVTSLNPDYQQAAENAVHEAIDKYRDARRVTEGALVAVDVDTGEILALVGGYDYSASKYNRAVQADRQVGSAFKPFVYATALIKGFSPSYELRDLKMTYHIGPGQFYTPKNSDLSYRGIVNMVYALQYSRNAATVDLANRVGPENIIETAKKMGIKSRLDDVLSLALGVCDVTPLEMAASFNVIARGGTYVEPVAILQVYDRSGVLLEDHTADIQLRTREAIPTDVAVTLRKMMERVITGGTGTSARFKNGEGQYQPAAGKTGTTEDFGDAWFIGFTPKITAAVWVGNDDFRRKMARVFGATIPAPTWKNFMQEVYKDRPLEQFKVPADAEYNDIPSSSARPVSDLEDIQVEGNYYYKFTIDVEEVLKEMEEEEEKAKEEAGSGRGDGASDESSDEPPEIYF